MPSRVLAAALFALVLSSSVANAAPTLREVEDKVVAALKRESAIKSVRPRGDGCVDIKAANDIEMIGCFDNLMLRIQAGENADEAISSYVANAVEIIPTKRNRRLRSARCVRSCARRRCWIRSTRNWRKAQSRHG